MHEIRNQQGFEIRVLGNDRVELTSAPALGAKVISLKNRASGREWMWRPRTSIGLFTNRLGEDFPLSPLVGWDECIPTIAPCQWKGRSLPDHGEAWSAPWEVDEEQWRAGVLKMSLALEVSPLRFERSIRLNGNEIQVDYALSNLGSQSESYLWAMHPLMPITPGDRIELAPEIRAKLGGPTWLDALDVSDRRPQYVKTHAEGISQGHAAVVNDRSGDRLDFDWDASENNVLGLWLTRGGWNGHHHMAIEPTNAAADSLAAVKNDRSAIASGAVRKWSVRLKLTP